MRPSLPALVDRATGDLAGRVGPFPFRSLENVVARSAVGALHSEYDAVDVVRREAIPDSSTGDDLRAQAADWGVPPLADARAAGNLTVTASTTGTIAAGQRFFIGALEYRADADVTWGAPGALAVAVTAVAPGPSFNVAAGSTAQLGPPLGAPPSTGSIVVAAGGLAGGVHELQEDLRSRLFTHARGPADIGRIEDYIRWAFEAPTTHGQVFRAWARSNPSVPGQTIVWVVQAPPNVTTTPSGLADDVAAYIATKLPIGATAAVVVPTFNLMLVTILTGAVPISLQLEDDVTDAVKDLFWTVMEPGDGLGKGAIRRGQIEQAARSAGAPNGAVIAPAADAVPGWGVVNHFLAVVVS